MRSSKSRPCPGPGQVGGTGPKGPPNARKASPARGPDKSGAQGPRAHQTLEKKVLPGARTSRGHRAQGPTRGSTDERIRPCGAVFETILFKTRATSFQNSRTSFQNLSFAWKTLRGVLKFELRFSMESFQNYSYV